MQAMTDAPEPLVLDLVEWIASEPRSYADVLDRWRTSCPRLTVWEDALDLGFVERPNVPGRGMLVTVTGAGEGFLRDHQRDVRPHHAGLPARTLAYFGISAQ